MEQPPNLPPPQPAPVQYGAPAPPAQGTNGLAVAALVCGILGVTVLFGIASIPALICGYIARGQIKRSQGAQDGSGMAMAGIVLGWIGLLLSLLMIVLLFAGAIALFGFATSDEVQEVIQEGTEIVVDESIEDVTEAEAGCTGIESYADMGQQHIDAGASHEPYNSSPPTSGPHYALPADTGFYPPDSVVEPETLVHNLEHGQVVIWYRPYVDPFLEEQVEALVDQEPAATVGAPFENMNQPYNIVLTTWTKARACEQASQEVVDDFRRQFQGVAPEPLTPPFEG